MFNHNEDPKPPKFHKTALIIFATAAISTLAQALTQWGFEHFKKHVSKPEEKADKPEEKATDKVEEKADNKPAS